MEGWLFYDHHRRDELANRILGLSEKLMTSRRWYYFIPASGEPRGLVHRIEPHSLDGLPGERHLYSRWTELHSGISDLLEGALVVAMQYSPNNAVPYVSMVDGGTIDFLRSLRVDVRSSANLVQLFEARWSDSQYEGHLEAGRRMDRIRASAFDLIRSRITTGTPVSEWDVHQFLHDQFHANDLVTDHGPIVAVNANASDPHYEPSFERHSLICPGDLVLIDMWAKLNRENSVYYDITWTGFCGPVPTESVRNVFDVVTSARDRGIEIVEARAHTGQLHGFEVDDAVRGQIQHFGLAEYFIHRTGHSIGTNVHGSGANMDNFETHDDRRIIPRTCFSIEPGVYLPEFGIRSEVNVYVADDGAGVTGEVQSDLVILG
ncbi:MAG: aminopeptidase P family protein [Bryobacteraceae bacterium]|nr:aminopeptidase P family protein [Bryobacteraceae bacterium]